MRRRFVDGALMSVMLLLTACSQTSSNQSSSAKSHTTSSVTSSKTSSASQSEQLPSVQRFATTAPVLTTQTKALASFIAAHMLTSQGGINTNYLDSGETKDVATGHEWLSESSGLYLQYLAQTDQADAFSRFYQQTKAIFWQQDQFSYRYDARTNKRYPVNASVDDLRIMRSLLMMAANHPEDQQWVKVAWRVYRAFAPKGNSNGNLVDYFDAKTGKQAPEITLCYLDLSTLRYFESDAQYQAQLNRLKNGLISSDRPLFEQRYSYQTKTYNHEATLNSVESLLSAVQLAAVNALPETTVTWLKTQVSGKHLVNAYTRAGKPASKDQSAAVYALAAQIGQLVGDQTLHKQALDRAFAFQIKTKGSSLNGALGDAATQTVYSFDNLMTLVTATA
ncbi:glycosyl hydrolase [Lacticaseibacillus saniviri]